FFSKTINYYNNPQHKNQLLHHIVFKNVKYNISVGKKVESRENNEKYDQSTSGVEEHFFQKGCSFSGVEKPAYKGKVEEYAAAHDHEIKIFFINLVDEGWIKVEI